MTARFLSTFLVTFVSTNIVYSRQNIELSSLKKSFNLSSHTLAVAKMDVHIKCRLVTMSFMNYLIPRHRKIIYALIIYLKKKKCFNYFSENLFELFIYQLYILITTYFIKSEFYKTRVLCVYLSSASKSFNPALVATLYLYYEMQSQ